MRPSTSFMPINCRPYMKFCRPRFYICSGGGNGSPPPPPPWKPSQRGGGGIGLPPPPPWNPVAAAAATYFPPPLLFSRQPIIKWRKINHMFGCSICNVLFWSEAGRSYKLRDHKNSNSGTQGHLYLKLVIILVKKNHVIRVVFQECKNVQNWIKRVC